LTTQIKARVTLFHPMETCVLHIPVRAGDETAATVTRLVISTWTPHAVIDAAPPSDTRLNDDPGGVR